MKKLFAVIALVIVGGLIIYFQDYIKINPEASLEYVKNQSYHSNFKITEENKVVITEIIHIKNSTNKNINLEL